MSAVRQTRSSGAAIALALAAAACSPAAPEAPAPKPAAARTALEVTAPEAPACKAATMPDIRALRRALHEGRFEALSASLLGYQEAVQRDVACEDFQWYARRAFEPGEDWVGPRLDEWVTADPGRFPAWAARGYYRRHAGFEARGQRFAAETRADQFARMRQWFAASEADLRKALELEPAYLPAYGGLIVSMSASGRHADADALAGRALEIRPASYELRYDWIRYSEPKWGGSLEKVDAIAREAQAHVEANPVLVWLKGFPYAARGEMAFIEGDQRKALELYREALRHGDEGQWLTQVGYVCWRLEDWPCVIRALQLHRERHEPSALVEAHLGAAYLKIGSQERAIEAYRRACELDPHHYTSTLADALRSLRRYPDAQAAYEAGLEREPGNPYLLSGIGQLLYRDLHRPADALPHLERWSKASPRDPWAWFNLGEAYRALGDARQRQAYQRYLALADAMDPQHEEYVAMVRSYLQQDPGATRDPSAGEFGNCGTPGLARYLPESARARCKPSGG
jgi:tetratricopeptide (TPR) repeat protein